MKYPFYYCCDNLDIKSISVIGDFNNWDGGKNILKRHDDGTWMTEIELSPGKYRYKFLINDSILFNDPNALIYTYDDKGGTASFIIIDESNKRIINTKPASLNIESYSFLSVDKELSYCENGERKCYKDKHSSIMLKIGFSDITGLHTVNAIWYAPNNEIHEIQESVLNDGEKNENRKNEALFQININDDTIAGEWKLQIFINGSLALEDSFTVELKQPEVLDKTALDDAAMLSADLEVPDFLIEEDMQNEFEAPEFEVESNLQTNAEKEEISEEDLLGLFDDIKEIDMPEKDTSGNQKTPAPDETEMPADGNIMNLFDEIRISELKDEKAQDTENNTESTSKEAEESDSAIDELLEPPAANPGKKQMKKISVT